MIRKLESKPFLFFFRDHLRSTLGITCGRGSFAVHFGDHLRSRDHLRYCTGLGKYVENSPENIFRRSAYWVQAIFYETCSPALTR